jgi:endonuclease/exonuclease/phosphatase family metal-dependent hydrolase
VIEIPFERQRRLATRVSVDLPEPAHARLEIVNVHLENRSGGWRVWRTLGAGRGRQARDLLRHLPPEGPLVVGGDFNTWFRGDRESAVTELRRRFPERDGEDRRPTAPRPFWPDPRIDYLFFDLPEAWTVTWRRLDDTYGSDHYPLLARIRFEGAGP